MSGRYAEVAVHAPVDQLFHYRIPPALADRELVGCRVLVPFGNRGLTGVVVAIRTAVPAGVGEVRALDRVLDEAPLVSVELLELCAWIADYYEAAPGEVLRAALPAGTQVSATRHVVMTDAGELALAGQGGVLPRRQRELLAALSRAGGGMAQKQLLRGRGKLADLDSLASAGLVEYSQISKSPRVRAPTTRVARLSHEPSADELATLARAHKRRAVLEALIGAGGEADISELARLHPRAAAHLRALAAAGLVELSRREVVAAGGLVDAADDAMVAPVEAPRLNAAQQTALTAINEGIGAGEFRACLLHGVTGSGKTEVYLHAIAEVVAAGRSAVVLVPEISLTPQLAARFRARFGDRVAVLHSGLSDRDRFAEWQRLRSGDASIALGARSAIYAPVSDLGIVVVDEEHDSSFKQEEGVRYNARDVALVRAQRNRVVCVLGSATPSLESYHAALAGRYQLLDLPDRATSRPLPTVELVDMRTYKSDGEAMLTAPLAEAIAETLAAGDQAILFLNRRGFSTFIHCRSCGYAFRCAQCSVSMTYHRSRDRLLCHYCGNTARPPSDCPSCSSKDSIVRRGLGTEKIADGVAERFPGARVARLDRDVASGAGIGKILARVARREVDILVGTQMVTKGHDFPGVTLVGVLCADTGLSLPDFRAAERTFQLLTQVAGRAGRGDRSGRVVIQSYRTEAVPIAAAARQDFAGFYAAEVADREELGYPPFGHLIAIRLDSTDAGAVAATARELAVRARRLGERLGDDVGVLGPSEAPLARLKGRTRWHLWLRCPDRKKLRRFLHELVERPAVPTGRVSVRVTIDVDPVSAL